MRIGFACDWKKPRIRSWSHTAFSLFTALSKIPGIETFDIDISLPQYQVYAYALLNARIANGSLKSRFRFSPAYTKRLEQNFERFVKQFAPLDAIIEIVDLAVTDEAPCYFYQDLSVDMLIEYYREHGKPRPMFEMYTMDDLLRRQERQRTLYERCAGVFCMSRSLAESLVTTTGLPHSKVHVVHAGVHVQPVKVAVSPFQRNNHPMILFVGRDFFRKAGDLVVEAFKMIRKERLPSVKLVVAGPKKWPLPGEVPEGVHFLGDASWEVLQQFYSRANLFCMPSRDEGFGIVFAEALCYGVPCAARQTPIMSEIIQPGVNGYLLEKEDVHELAELMMRGIGNKSLRLKVQESAQKYKDYYSWKRVAFDMVRIVRQDKMSSNAA